MQSVPVFVLVPMATVIKRNRQWSLENWPEQMRSSIGCTRSGGAEHSDHTVAVVSGDKVAHLSRACELTREK